MININTPEDLLSWLETLPDYTTEVEVCVIFTGAYYNPIEFTDPEVVYPDEYRIRYLIDCVRNFLRLCEEGEKPMWLHQKGNGKHISNFVMDLSKYEL